MLSVLSPAVVALPPLMAAALPNPDPLGVVSTYWQHMAPVFAHRGLADQVSVQSIPIETAPGIFVHALAVVPPAALRTVVYAPGAFHSAVTMREALAEFNWHQTAVIVFETYSHGLVASPYSYRHPETRHAKAMRRALRKLLGRGLLPFFARYPELKTKPIHLLGHSMGGGTVVDHATHREGNLSLSLGVAVKKPYDNGHRVQSLALINPRLVLGSKYPWQLRTLVAPALRFLLWASRGTIEKKLRIPSGRPSGVAAGSEEAAWYDQMAAAGFRLDHVPLAYGTSVFAHDRAVAQRIYARRFFPEIPILWALWKDDHETDPAAVAALALHIGGTQSLLMPVDCHTPLRGEGLPQMVQGLVRFWESAEGEVGKPLWFQRPFLALTEGNIEQVLY